MLRVFCSTDYCGLLDAQHCHDRQTIATLQCELDAAIAQAAQLAADNARLRAELDAARAGWLDPDTQYPADRQPIIVLLEHEATYYTGEDDPTGDALPEFELWGYQRIVGWRPLPAAPDDGGEEAG